MKNIFQKKISILLLLTIAIIQSCSKDETKINPNDNSLGLKLSSLAETSGIPATPEFLIGSLSASITLDMPPIGNQGMQGSCVSWSTAYAGMSFFMNRLNGTHYNSNQELCSPKYVYNQISQGACNGTSIPANLNILQNKGVCTLKEMPYNDGECSLQPNSTQNTNAVNNKIFAWRMVDKNNINIIKSCIAAKYPVFIAVNVDESFDNLQYPYIWSTKSGSSRGGHAITVVGYDDSKNAFKVQNSWGASWKDNGHLWISYSFFAQAVIGTECYIAFPQITSPNDNINSGLVLNMPFNGNANDISGNNNNGLVSGANLTSDRKGNSNSAYKFNGTSSPSSVTINTSTSLNNLTSYSICLWSKYDSNSGDDGTGNTLADGNTQTSWQTILYKGGNTFPQYNTAYRFLVSSQSNIFGIYLGSKSGGQTSGAYSKIGEWHHYVISKQGNILKMFKDGILIWDLQNSFANLSDANGFNLMLGKSSVPGNGVPFNGVLDEFRIYNRALTASEVQKIYKL
jgi:Papain family cysteine protease/Concanavalin A-like lectin/glucanases superfamily